MPSWQCTHCIGYCTHDLDIQGHAAMPTRCSKWWAALRGSTGFPHLPARGARHHACIGCQCCGLTQYLNQLGSTTTFDPASLYKLAMSKFAVEQLGSGWFHMSLTQQLSASFLKQNVSPGKLVHNRHNHNNRSIRFSKLAGSNAV